MPAEITYRNILQEELEKRLRRNPQYSLRSFAKDLGVSNALLSDVLRGKCGLSLKRAITISDRLGMSHQRKEWFCSSVESLHARSQGRKTIALARLKKLIESKASNVRMKSLSHEEFSVVSEWYAFAILELMKMKEAPADPRWFARRLNISDYLAKSAIERFTKMNVIEMRNGRWHVLSEVIETPVNFSGEAIRHHHDQFLQLSIQALYSQPKEERDFRGLTIKCNKSSIESVRSRLKQFLIELDLELSQDPEADHVYRLSTQFFRLTDEKFSFQNNPIK